MLIREQCHRIKDITKHSNCYGLNACVLCGAGTVGSQTPELREVSVCGLRHLAHGMAAPRTATATLYPTSL